MEIVDSKRNPADIASRGLMPGEDNSFWLNSLDFLLEQEDLGHQTQTFSQPCQKMIPS